jgi:hypothetical protein
VENEPVEVSKSFNLTIQHRSAPVHSTFLWDSYLKRLTRFGDVLHQEFDVVVFGMGSWPASYGQWSMPMFGNAVERLSEALGSASRGTNVLLVYAGSPAWPKHRKGTPGFRITNTRLGIMNQIAYDALLRVGAWILPLFDMSYPMAKMKSKDDMHYDRSVVLYTAVEYLADIICARQRL